MEIKKSAISEIKNILSKIENETVVSENKLEKFAHEIAEATSFITCIENNINLIDENFDVRKNVRRLYGCFVRMERIRNIDAALVNKAKSFVNVLTSENPVAKFNQAKQYDGSVKYYIGKELELSDQEYFIETGRHLF